MTDIETVVKPPRELFFDIDARHVRQLGQELVGDKVTALVELVKNAYDADATKVNLSFDLDASRVLYEGQTFESDATPPSIPGKKALKRDFKGKLIIEDNGSGMSLETIQAAWMRIASDDKEQNSRSPRLQRIRAGRKGIGRFAAESLGEHLTLRSTVEGSTTAVEVSFDWTRGYEAGKSLSAVANTYRLVSSPIEERGVKLEIWGLYDSWSLAQRQRVARALLLLQPPLAQSVGRDGLAQAGRQDFAVTYSVNGAAEHANSIEAFLDGETAHIEASVDASGEVELHVTSQVFNIDRKQKLETKFLVVGEVELNASYFIYRKDAIGVPVRTAQKMAAEYGGIRVYRDGLRLLPYGEKNDDWLGLDEASRRREYLNPIGNQNFFAQVLLGRDRNPLLQDTSSREGLINNEAYEEFQVLVREILITSAKWVAEFRERRARGGSPKKVPVSRSEILATVQGDVGNLLKANLSEHDSQAILDQVEKAFSSTSVQAEHADSEDTQIVENLLNEVELLRLLASLGTSISVFSHEVRSIISVAMFEIGSGNLDQPSGLSVKSDALDRLGSLRDLAKYIDSYSGGVRAREREPQPMSATISRFVSGFADHLARGFGVTYEVWPPSLRTAEMGGTTLQAIYINLFTNAVKALDHEAHVDRRIHISAIASPDHKRVILRFQDSGRGIDDTVADTLFDAFVTTSSVSSVDFGVGTGLGLKVVRDLVEEYGGTVFVGVPESSFATCIQVELPRWSKQIK